MSNKSIILFDGDCNFCNYWVKYVIERDKKDKFRFTSLQSDTGKELLKQYNLKDDLETVVLIENNKAFAGYENERVREWWFSKVRRAPLQTGPHLVGGLTRSGAPLVGSVMDPDETLSFRISPRLRWILAAPKFLAKSANLQNFWQ